MKQALRNLIARSANNWRGWRTNRKIVVIESDDWGSVCMPSKEIYAQLINDGFRVDECPYATFDSLASEEDLDELFSALSEIKDSKGNPAVITANSVMTNPDFENIRESNAKEYHFESFTETLEKQFSGRQVEQLWQEGKDEGIFFPQFHGREHLNIQEWMGQIADKQSAYYKVLPHGVCWLGSKYNPKNGVNLRATYDTKEQSDLPAQKENLYDGLRMFEQTFNYPSKSFIAPNYTIHPDLYGELQSKGVYIIQGMKYQKLPLMGEKKHQMSRRIQGEVNEVKQVHLVRNCVFEPSQYPESHDNVGECLKGIQNAFLWKKPAIISAHRLNFIGAVHPENRERNLAQFRELLAQIIKRWQDVEFMTSVDLGSLIAESK